MADAVDPERSRPWGIREAHEADRPLLFALQGYLDEPSPDLLRSALAGVGTVWVSTAAGDPVGYLLAVPAPDAVHLAELVVAPDHRREGRATALLEAALARAGDRPTTLAVAPDNAGARRCYEQLGFRVRRRDPDYFQEGPALIMVRE